MQCRPVCGQITSGTLRRAATILTLNGWSAQPPTAAQHPADQLDVHRDDGRTACAAPPRSRCSANYLAKRLAPHYPTLYTGRNDLVAHECILDRPLEKATGISAGA